MKFDDVLREIGEFGPYQKRVYFLATFPLILAAFEGLNVVFTFYTPSHRCAIPGYPDDQYHVINDTQATLINASIPKDQERGGQWSRCLVYDDVNYDDIYSNLSDVHDVGAGSRDTKSCDKWVYDHSVFEATISTEVFIGAHGICVGFEASVGDLIVSWSKWTRVFDIVCDRRVLRASSNLFVELGALVGNVVCGIIADRFGRKFPFYVGGLGMIAGGFGIAFVTNIITLNVCRFLLGVARKVIWANGLVIGMEIVGPSKRVFAGIVIELMWCVGMFLLLVIAYFIRNWRYLEIALSVPSVVLLAYWWLLPESPRWLASKGRDKEALQILEKIASSNKTQLPKMDDVRNLLEPETSLSLRHVFKSRELIIRLLISCSNLSAMVMIYYTLTYSMSNLAGDVFINFLISAIMETLGLLAPFFVLDRLGRKKVYCVTVLLAGGSCAVCFFPAMFDAPAWVIISLAIIGRFFVCVAASTLYIYITEIFPTVIRASSVGLVMTISRVGGLVAPYVADAGVLLGGKLEKALPLMISGTPALLAGLFSLWLPETMGTKLPETMDDLKHRKRRCFCGSKQKPDSREITSDEELRDTTSSPC